MSNKFSDILLFRFIYHFLFYLSIYFLFIISLYISLYIIIISRLWSRNLALSPSPSLSLYIYVSLSLSCQPVILPQHTNAGYRISSGDLVARLRCSGHPSRITTLALVKATPHGKIPRYCTRCRAPETPLDRPRPSRPFLTPPRSLSRRL